MWEVVFPNHPMSQNLWKGWERVGGSTEHGEWAIPVPQSQAASGPAEHLRIIKAGKASKDHRVLLTSQHLQTGTTWQLLWGISC